MSQRWPAEGECAEDLTDEINSLTEKIKNQMNKDKEPKQLQEEKNKKRNELEEQKQRQDEEVPLDIMQELCDIVDNIGPVYLSVAQGPEPNATEEETINLK